MIVIPGINIQSPWAYLLVHGIKTVETRTYPLPVKYMNKELALIETPGPKGKFKSRIIGTITFSHTFKYNDELEWKMDYPKHRVDCDSPLYGWNKNKSKYGWVVSNVKPFKNPVDPPKRRGIIFSKGCLI